MLTPVGATVSWQELPSELLKNPVEDHKESLPHDGTCPGIVSLLITRFATWMEFTSRPTCTRLKVVKVNLAGWYTNKLLHLHALS